MTEVPAHLGGQNGRCWDDEGCLDWAIKTFDVKSMLDIGCGYGCQVNYIDAFKSGKYVICTHAQPGQAGHHHVNCKPQSYWIDLFGKHGLFYSEEYTRQMKEASTMGKPFIKRNGLFFKQWPS